MVFDWFRVFFWSCLLVSSYKCNSLLLLKESYEQSFYMQDSTRVSDARVLCMKNQWFSSR
ncbi:unnamed protein product [Brassica oleracea var. botrytis]|uniref:(rape) hypothetical protein n=1 Tax=Brassica napus TaxID=3708 RepID=A0A816R6U4_BRANA|nr:unnamed protein product [Brassica napus]